MLHTKAYKDLSLHYKSIKNKTLLDLFALDNSRFSNLHLSLEKLVFDFSKNNITEETLTKLIDLAKEQGLAEQIVAMFRGNKINNTESRAVLHTALRANGKPIIVDDCNVSVEIQQVLDQIRQFSDKLHNGNHLGYSNQPITDIVNIGIGGSDLGPVLVSDALKPYCKSKLNIHFISSVDGYQVFDILSHLNPETTLFIIASKTFTTQETMTNAHTVRNWFLEKTNNNLAAIKQHFVAVSTNVKAVSEFGIAVDNMFRFWDFVGGRYSIWSAIGLPVALYIGFENFSKLLSGARAMDEHFANTHDFRQNLPVILALIGIWYVNFYDYSTQVISPYNTRLSRFPAYIQQLEMESNGKSVDKNGEPLEYKTAPVIWGDSGINAQHAYYQLLHQGTGIYPMDIILGLSDKFSNQEHQDILVSNAFAQAEAFMCGKTYAQARSELLFAGSSEATAYNLAKHKVFHGNRPSNMLLLPEISPYYLGMLIALYEHKTFVQGVIWGINSFDQWGVELGKQLAKTILTDINSNQISTHDDSTNNLINLYKRCR
ncbi:MAG: glucose-6-phosphate isomerase [Burkholderiales bacterium]|nr:glucose-6-phosphate isomerase [Burkholderiales bacterium]